ncbi:glycosyltransferase [Streptomyces lichenis]|uniref:Glycosyltransferase n=1 Tax=Streptomyces lichenis TaxID=2306967 RepID=A0ABT0IH10_9ACTN|nr:glycosyltransferase [Streptomyces lichenis]MCK8680617.1 glycosyltransferase [Streptomyces lichenis]
MSRYLFVVPPLSGHVNPAAEVAAELTSRGHTVAWAGRPGIIGRLVGEEAEVYVCAGPDGLHGRPPELRGVAALQFLWRDFFVPLADAMADGVTAAVDHFRPDVVVSDQQALAGALVAERLGVPYATSATTSAELTDSLGGMPSVAAWLTELLTGARARLGDPAATGDPRFSPYLTLAFTTPEFLGAAHQPRQGVRFVGPALPGRPGYGDFPWEWLGRQPDAALVLVTLGTVNQDAGARFLAETAAALRERSDRLRAVVADPGGALASADPGPTVLVRPFVPQRALLGHVSAVICHAGHNTVAETLWHGVPLVVAPIRDDQPVVARQVVDAGAGVRLRFGRAGRAQIGAALDTVLTEPRHHEAARRLRASFHRAGGAGAAAEHLEELARHPTRHPTAAPGRPAPAPAPPGRAPRAQEEGTPHGSDQ